MTCATCPTCALGLHHCHGLVVEHDDGTWACLDGCDGPLAVHDLVEPCADVGLGCCGGEQRATAPFPAPLPAVAAEEPAWAA